jgi:hypothetical protein
MHLLSIFPGFAGIFSRPHIPKEYQNGAVQNLARTSTLHRNHDLVTIWPKEEENFLESGGFPIDSTVLFKSIQSCAEPGDIT